MVEAKESRVSDILNYGEDGEILHLKAEISAPPATSFSYAPSDRERLYVNYKQKDPYESERVEVRKSTVKNAGDGVFAVRDLPANTFVCFYHGIYLEEGQSSPQENDDYQIFLDWKSAPASPSLDILQDAWDHNEYTASVGHKVNHSWEPNCIYDKFYHPVFGKTALGIKSVRSIDQGEELFTHYRYDPNDCPDWYSNTNL